MCLCPCPLCSRARELLCDVFVPVLRTVLLAPASSPLSTVNANNIVDLLVHLTTVKGEGQVGGVGWGGVRMCTVGARMGKRDMWLEMCDCRDEWREIV